MAEEKKSFVLYSDLIHTVRKMPKDKQGELFMTILAYVNDENPTVDDLIVELVFEPIKLQMKRDLAKYETTKERRKEAGRIAGLKSGEARKTSIENSIQIEPIEPNRTNGSKNEPNEHVTDTVNVTDTVTDTDTVTVINKERENKRFSPPSLLEVQDYIIEKKYGVNAHSFWNFYESKNWMVGKNKMKDYKKAIAGWEAREKDNSNKNQNGKQQFTNPVKTAYKFDAARIIETNTRKA